MSTTSTGRSAESLAADYLVSQGYTILDRNWRNRWCELDIVTRQSSVVQFIEVKYRSSTAYGLPAEYVGRDKLGRLARAAAAWTQAHSYTGPYQIDVISVSGSLDTAEIIHIPDITG